MNFIKKIWDKIKAPKTSWLVLFYITFFLVAAGTIVLVVLIPNQTILHYVLYSIAAIMMTYFVYTIVILSPKAKHNVINFLKKYKFTKELLYNFGYRKLVFAIISLILNIAYVIFMGIIAIMSLSPWYLSLTIYYLTLTLMIANIFTSKRKHNTPVKKVRAYRFCGIMFILLTIAFSGIIVLIYTTDMTFEYAGLMIYVIATYTFYRLTLAIYNIFKYKSQEDLYIQSLSNISLVTALISIIVLQVAMFQSFAPQHNTSIANALTGAGISAIILALGIFMIIKANKKLKNIEEKMSNKNKQTNKQQPNDFEFKYTAPTAEERKEIESIRNSYTEPHTQNSELNTLRKLNNKVKNLPTTISLIVGILGTLLFGTGMTMVLEWNLIGWGVIVCAIAIVPIAIAYPICNKMNKYLRNKYSEQIISLSDSLLNKNS